MPENCLRVESCIVGVIFFERDCVEICGEGTGTPVVIGASGGVRLARFPLGLMREGPGVSCLAALVLPVRIGRGTDGLLAGVLFGSKIFAFGLRADVIGERVGPSPARQPLTDGCVYLYAGCESPASIFGGIRVGIASGACVSNRRRNGIVFVSDEAKDITYFNRFLFTELKKLWQSASSATSMCSSVSQIAV